MIFLLALLHALPDAAAIGALLSVFIGPDVRIFGIIGNKILGFAVFLVMFTILAGKNIYVEHKHQLHIDYIEHKIAFLISGHPMSIEQLQDYFFKPNLDDLEEAISHMEALGSVLPSKHDATVMGLSNLAVKVRVFKLLPD